MELDHLAVVAGTLAEGVAAVEAALGVPLQPGGAHPQMGTHNRLLSLGDLYLEVIAVDPAAPPPGRPRWFAMDAFAGPPRLTNWVCRCADLDAECAEGPPGLGDPLDLERGDLRWRMAVPPDGLLPFGGLFPALIAWQGTAHPAPRLTDRGCRLKRLTVTLPAAEELRAALAGRLSDRRLDIEPGPEGLTAEIETPSGLKVLR